MSRAEQFACRRRIDIKSVIKGCDEPYARGFMPSSACSEPLILGSNILRDPGFEHHLARVLSGPDPYNFHFPGDSFGPGASNPGSLNWSFLNITDPLYYDINGWATYSNNEGTFCFPGSNVPIVSTASPRSGIYHYRLHIEEDCSDDNGMAPVGGRYCNPYLGRIQAYSARVVPGSVVTFGAWVKSSITTSNPYAYIIASWFDINFSNIGNEWGDTGFLMNTSYQYHSQTWVAPPNAYAIAIEIEQQVTYPHATVDFDMDDCVLSVL